MALRSAFSRASFFLLAAAGLGGLAFLRLPGLLTLLPLGLETKPLGVL